MTLIRNDRTRWTSALIALPTNDLLSLTSGLSGDWTIRPRSIPQSGLGMLKMNDSAFEEPFYLGEFPVASAWLEIQTPEGQLAEAHAGPQQRGVLDDVLVGEGVVQSDGSDGVPEDGQGVWEVTIEPLKDAPDV